MGFEEDVAWFDANRKFIADQYGGQWVLIKDKAVRGAYPSYQAAYNAGVSMFGTERFVVKEALEVEPEARI